MSLDTTSPLPQVAQCLTSVPTFDASIVSIVDIVTSTGGAASTFYKATDDSTLLISVSFEGYITGTLGSLSVIAVIDGTATTIAFRFFNDTSIRHNIIAVKEITGISAGQHSIYYAISFPGFVTTNIKFANINIHDFQTMSILEVEA